MFGLAYRCTKGTIELKNGLKRAKLAYKVFAKIGPRSQP